MAEIQQLIDHVNASFRKEYKEGIWINASVTRIAKNSKDIVFIECIDEKKYREGKPTAKMTLRLTNIHSPKFKMLIEGIGASDYVKQPVSFPAGSVVLAFKILPAMHFEGGIYPIVKDIKSNSSDISLLNLKSGFRIGVSNTQLGKPRNHQKKWTQKEREELIYLTKQCNLSIESISLRLERTAIACLEEIENLGLVDKSKLSSMRKDAVNLAKLSESQ